MVIKRDLLELLQSGQGYDANAEVQSIAPAAVTTTADGTSCDLKEYDSLVVRLDLGVWTDGTFVFTIEESADNSTFTTVAAADLEGAVGSGNSITVDAADEDLAIHHIGYFGTKRYARVSFTAASTTTGMVFSATLLRGHKKRRGILTN